MNDKEIIKKVLDNLENYEVYIHYSTNHSNYRLEFYDNSEEYCGSFKIENIMDFDILIFNNDHQISLEYFQCEKIIEFLNAKEHIRNFYDEIRSYDAIKKYFNPITSNKYLIISNENIMILNNLIIDSLYEYEDHVEFWQEDKHYSYNLINDSKNRKWFHKDGDEILIFNKESSWI